MSSWLTENESLIQSALVLAIFGYSLQVAMRAGVFSLAGAGFYAVGGYGAGALTLKHGWAPLPALLAAILAAGVVGLVLSLILGRLRSLYLAMATVAFDLLIQVAATQWKEETGGPLGLYGVPVAVTTTSLIVAVAIASALLVWREHGASRRTLEALRLDEEVAPVLGIDVRRRRHQAFVLSSMLGALAGGLNVMLFTTITPHEVGFNLIVSGLTIIVIGGISSWVGALVGAFIVTWLPELLAFSGSWRPVIQGLIIVFAVVWFNDGLVGVARRGWRWLREHRPRARSVVSESVP